jgi:hypothetical protein
MWIWTVLTSEFFWGVIVGLVLSVFGSYWLAKFSASETRKTQKELVKAFCADTVSNLKKIVDGMSGLGGWGLSDCFFGISRSAFRRHSAEPG